MHQIPKIVLTVMGLIALYLVLAHGNSFNTILSTAGTVTNKGITVLQGRDASAAT